MAAMSRRRLLLVLLATAIPAMPSQIVASGGTENELSRVHNHSSLHVALPPMADNSSTDDNETETTAATTLLNVVLEKGTEDQEHKSSMAIFFILFVIMLSILLVHLLIVTKFHYIPESLAIVLFGALIGLVLSFSSSSWKEEEALKPNAFFLVLLPPIIFESGYNLNKGNFFANLGSILLYAILGTGISAFVVGGGLYVLGQADLIYALSAVDSFAFASMISAIDPVATLAIFQALKVDPVLYMLVFGESVLNDAVAIVLATTVLELNEPSMAALNAWDALFLSCQRFLLVFFGSAALGVAAGLTSALLLKHVDLRQTPSLEFGVLLVFGYLPYGLAEGVHLSGIMAILFCGITMSHYTHFNLSPMTQITMQQTFRTLAFIAETCTFAYLGMAFFTFPLFFDVVFIVWAILLCLIGRAVNIFSLSLVVNQFREHRISRKNQFIMWFSGLRGAVAYALALHMSFANERTQQILLAATLTIVLFTIVVLGGGTMPLMKILNDAVPDETATGKRRKTRRKRRKRSALRTSATGKKSRSEKGLLLSKTQEMNTVLDRDYSFSEVTETDDGGGSGGTGIRGDTTTIGGNGERQGGIARIDARLFRPLFVRRFTVKEKNESTMKLTDMALQWYKAAQQQSDSDQYQLPAPPSVVVAVAQPPSSSPDSDDDADTLPLI